MLQGRWDYILHVEILISPVAIYEQIKAKIVYQCLKQEAENIL